jgi:hypothetical protein
MLVIMRTPYLALLVSAVLAGACGAAIESTKTKPVLEKGMDAATIIQLVGKPDEISRLQSGEANAETWIYRRKINQTIHQTANTQAFIPAMVGFQASGPVIGKALVPEYRLKYVRDYQVTALLMVDGKLQLGRQWLAQDEQFAD